MGMTSDKDLVLVVDDNKDNLKVMQAIFSKDSSLRLQFATSGEMALKKVSDEPPDLILLDMHMPGMTGMDVLRELQADNDLRRIPVIFVTADGNSGVKAEALEMGAIDYIEKPVDARITRLRVRNNLERYLAEKKCRLQVLERTRDVRETQMDALDIIATVGHFNDDNTGLHVERMAKYARVIACGTVFDTDEFERAASLHDGGKIGVSDLILRKPGKLNATEWEAMKAHTTIGRDMFGASHKPVFVVASNIAWCHHEKWDGRGYPRGLSREKIPLEARIAAIADVFDALTMRRPYKEPWPVEKAISVMRQDTGTHFDPSLMPVFFEKMSEILSIKDRLVDEL